MIRPCILFLILGAVAPTYALDAAVKDQVDGMLASAKRDPGFADGPIDHIAGLGDDALLYALPELIRFAPTAVQAGDRTYILSVLGKASNMDPKKITLTKDLADGLTALADPKNVDMQVCLERMRVNLYPDSGEYFKQK